jgi:uncharacterized integral membrane protein (TIGR00698 family)
MGRILPGLLLCVAIGLAAIGLEWIELLATGRAWIDSLVVAILLGTLVRSLWTPSPLWLPGIDFSAKFLLEVAVVLLGASLSAQAISAAGPALLAGIAAVVTVSLAATYAIGRIAGLPRKMALLVASGNSICGNSAIAAVAAVIGAKPADVASAIAFTAVLGVAVVLLLPFAAAPLGLDAHGVLAGLTVYAVPQVLAASAPMGALAVQVGTFVKLVRVLMLGPLVLALSLVAGRASEGRLPPIGRLVPWFVIGFVLMAVARSLGLIPEALIPALGLAATALTLLAMAGLGLGVDVRAVGAAGARVSAVVTLSLLLLAAMALGLVSLVEIAP